MIADTWVSQVLLTLKMIFDDNDGRPESNHSWLGKPPPWRLSPALPDRSSARASIRGPTHTANICVQYSLFFYAIIHFYHFWKANDYLSPQFKSSFVCFSPNLSPLAVESHWHREQWEGEERWWSTRVLYQYALPTENQINESKSERNESVVPIRNNMWVRLKEMKVKVLYHSQLKVCVAVVDGHCYLP